MNDTLFNFLGVAVGTFGGIVASSKLVNYRLQELEKKVDKHNSVIERTYKLEQDFCLIDEKMRVANYRIAGLEGEVKK